MNRTQYAKIFAFIASLLTGAVSIIGGDYVTGAGIIAASLSSSTMLQKGE